MQTFSLVFIEILQKKQTFYTLKLIYFRTQNSNNCVSLVLSDGSLSGLSSSPINSDNRGSTVSIHIAIPFFVTHIRHSFVSSDSYLSKDD